MQGDRFVVIPTFPKNRQRACGRVKVAHAKLDDFLAA